MGCVIDRADKWVAAETAAAIGKIRAAASGESPEGLPADCQDCGDPIPEARRAAVPGCTRCVDCQGVFEKQ